MVSELYGSITPPVRPHPRLIASQKFFANAGWFADWP